MVSMAMKVEIKIDNNAYITKDDNENDNNIDNNKLNLCDVQKNKN